jgi:hypothetical protein
MLYIYNKIQLQIHVNNCFVVKVWISFSLYVIASVSFVVSRMYSWYKAGWYINKPWLRIDIL